LHAGYFQAEFAQDATGHATFFQQQTNQDMFAPDIAVVKAFGLFLGQAQHAPGALSKSFPIL
jgi:hypothetical protein